VIYRDLAWESVLTPEQFRKLLITRQSLAHWLVEQTMEG
jgi:hypothetical protein